MNKKFSTLMAGLVLATGVVSAQAPTQNGFPYRSQDVLASQTAVTAGNVTAIQSENGWYQLTNAAGDQLLIQVRDFVTGAITLKMAPLASAPLNCSLWQIKVNGDNASGKSYIFTNKETGLDLVLDDTKAVVKVPSDAVATNAAATILDGCMNDWAWNHLNQFSTTVADALAPIYSTFHDTDSVMVMETKTNGDVVATKYKTSETGTNFSAITNLLKVRPIIADAIVLTAADINSMIDAYEGDSARFKFNQNGYSDWTTITQNVLGSNLYVAESVTPKDMAIAAATAAKDSAVTILDNALAFRKLATDATSATPAGAGLTLATTVANLTDLKTALTGLNAPATGTATDYKTAIDNIQAGATDVKTLLDEYDAITQAIKDAAEVAVPGIIAKLDAQAAALRAALYSVEFLGTQVANALTTFDIVATTYDNFDIRLKEYATTSNKYFMVDTARYEEADYAPSASPALSLVNKEIKSINPLVQARYNFRVTYFASNDSLLIEPLNASCKTDKNYNDGTRWDATDAGQKLIAFADMTAANTGIQVSNTVTNNASTVFADKTVSITVAKLKSNTYVPTITPAALKEFKVRISFDHAYPYLVRSTVESGLYNITLVTKDPNSSSSTLSRVNGSHIVANMAGQLIYAKKDKSQDYTHMPATQWVVEQLGCLKPNNNTARVKVTNREYTNIGFEGQLYMDADSNKYIINHNYDDALGTTNNDFCISDTLKFTSIADTKKGYLMFKEDTLRENTYTFNQFFNYGEDPYFLNVKDNKADTLVRAQNEATQFELFTSADSLKYGYPSEQAGVAQLYRASYLVKVKDANKIDNDRKFMAVDQNNKYVVATEADINAGLNGLRYAKFYFKENNHWVEGETGKEYYALVDSVNLTNGNWKLAVEQGQMDTKPEQLGESRTEAFYIAPDMRPLYRSLGKGNSVVKIFTERGTAKEYLYEDNSNKIGYPSAIEGFGYLGITAEGISQSEGYTVAMYADYVQKSNDRMPQYLFAVAPDSVKAYTWCKDHGLNPNCDHAQEYAGYVAGRYMINLNDSVANSINKLENANKFKYDNYTRLAFVEAVHRGDSLYVLKNGIKLSSIMGKDGAGQSYVLPSFLEKANEGKVYEIVPLNGQHNNAAFSLRLVDDGEAKDFYLESHSNAGESAIGSFEGAWVKLQNYVPVLAQNYNANGNHVGMTGNIDENINQAQKFNVAENVDETPTANDEVSISGISVVATNGAVIIKGAEGKKVSVSNILGQTIANTVITSSEATIAAPAGVVVVAVEGEAAVKAIVK